MQNYERRFEAVKEVTDWLAVRLTEQRQKLDESEQALARFRELNLFFGGVHAVARDPATGELTGGGDPRRGGSVAVA